MVEEEVLVMDGWYRLPLRPNGQCCIEIPVVSLVVAVHIFYFDLGGSSAAVMRSLRLLD